MVYCGKPSKSCRQCRNRDIKCDKREGSCGQCIRAHLVCPGYPNPQNLVFRDETDKAARKAGTGHNPPKVPGIRRNTSHAPRPRHSTQGLSNLPPTVPPLTQYTLLPAPLISPHITINLERHAKIYFATAHPFSPLMRIMTYFLIHTFSPDKPMLDHLVSAVVAASLAYFSRHHRPSSLPIMQKARLSYVTALKQTQEILSNPNRAGADTTLVAVLFLGIFENLTSKSERGVQAKEEEEEEESRELAQARHLDGAMALMTFRGEKQFDNWLGMLAFKQLSSSVLINCLEREVEVPAQFTALMALAARSRENADDVRWRYEETVVRLISLKAGAKSGRIGNEQSQAMARELDDECGELSRQILSSPIDVNKDRPSVSANHRTGSSTTTDDLRILNHIYIIRLALADITLPHHSITTVSSSSHTTKVDAMASICKAICASARNSVSFTSTTTAAAAAAAATTTPLPRSFLFPLYVAARSRFCPSALKEEIKALLAKLQEEDADVDAFKILRLLEGEREKAKKKEKMMTMTTSNEKEEEEDDDDVLGQSQKEVVVVGITSSNNPWREFAEQQLGELSGLGLL